MTQLVGHEPRFALGTGQMDRLRVMEEERGLRQEDVAEIVHDLKNPLATIALETCLLDHRIANGEYNDLQSAVDRIKHNVVYLDRMVLDLLDLCSLDAGRFEIHRRPTDLRDLVVQIVHRAVATRDRDRVFVEAPLAISLDLDDLRIERVIANFLQNAMKYAPAPTGVVVRLDRYSSAVCVSVTDAGPGIMPSDRQHIFEKYHRNASARGCEGYGLGLYVARKIVEAHGGRIGVDSVHGVGSRFYFELPLPS